MKKEFSKLWKGSKQPRKQRKYRANAPLHIRHKFLSAQLSKDLKKKYGKSNLPLRVGDEVLVMRGSFAKKKAKIISVDMTRTRVTLENVMRSKKDGTKIKVYFHPSNLQIQNIGSEDKKRLTSSSSTVSKVKTEDNKNAPN